MSESEAGMDTKKRKEHSSLESKALIECLTRKHAERGGVGTPTKRLTLAKAYQVGWNCFVFFFSPNLDSIFPPHSLCFALSKLSQGKVSAIVLRTT